MAYGVRIWRYRQEQWVYVSHTHEKYLLKPRQVETGSHAPLTDDWLFEETHGQAVPQRLIAANILRIVPDKFVPRTATVWCWAGQSLHRIYSRSNAEANVKEAPLQVQAVAGSCDEHDLILDCGPNEYPIHIHRSGIDPVEVESTDDVVDLGASEFDMGPVATHLAIAEFVANSVVETSIREAHQAIRKNDSEKFRKAGDVLLATFMGATPGPTQGTNVLLQLDVAIDDASRVANAIKSSGASSNDSGIQGNFGSIVASTDLTWQAAGTILSVIVDIFKINKLIHQKKSVSPSQKVDLEKIIRGTKLDLTSNILKGYSTVVSAISVLTSFLKGAGLLVKAVPIVSSITGLAAMARSTWQFNKSRKRTKRLKVILRTQGEQINEETQSLLAFALGKAMRKSKFKLAEAGVAAGSSASASCLAVGAALAVSNAWNPVGWGIGIGVVLSGGGLLTYKIVRRVRSKKRARRRGFESSEFPTLLVNTYVNNWRNDSDSIDTLALGGILESYGVEPEWLHLNTPVEIEIATQRVRESIFRIERHLK